MNRPGIKNVKKRKKDRKQREKQKFLALGDFLRSSNKVFIEDNSLFLARWFFRQRQTYMMECLRDKIMWLRLKTLRYLSRKEQETIIFVKKDFLHKKIQKEKVVFGYLTTKSLRKVV